MKSKSSSDTDMVPSRVLNKYVLALANPLLLLFNKFLSTGQIPSKWKSSYITPIRKSSDKRNIVNYRPISTISAIPKLLDAIVARKLSSAISSRIIQEEHGFIKCRSVITNLLLFTDDISKTLSKFYQLDTVYLDFWKAF